MKKFYSIILAVAVAMSVEASAELTLAGRALLNRQHRASANIVIDPISRQLKALPKQSNILATVEVASDDAVDALRALGCEIRSESDGYVIAIIPADRLEEAAATEGVARVSPARRLATKLDKARAATGVTSVHSGSGISQAYDGTGVVVGLMDFGVEPNHIAFKNSSGNTSRVRGITHFIGDPAYPSGNPQEGVPAYQKNLYSTAGQIAEFTTDNESDSHGTYALGVLAGGYTGNSYYGVAKNADIYVACGSTFDANILEGIEDIAKYAKRVNKPCVINLSMGSNLGPHDGTDTFGKSLAKIIKNYNATVCVAAGNEGTDKLSIIKSITSTNNSFKTMLMDNEYVGAKGNFISGGIDIWSNSSQAFTVQLSIYDIKNKRVMYTMPSIAGTTYGAYKYVSASAYATEGDYTPSVMNTAWPDGYFGVATQVDPSSKRYQAHIDLSAFNVNNYKNNIANNYRIAISVTGYNGQTISCYSDNYSVYFSGQGVSGYIDGTPEGSISNESCADGVISVGSWDSRDKYTDLAGRNWDFQESVINSITATSSYGKKPDGTKLPHVVAPGNIIIAPANKYCINSLLDLGVLPDVNQLPAKTGTEYWNVASGTSIASPMAAGIVALWLQANPTLTPADVMTIINSTSKKDSYTNSASAKAGAGKIDALAGVKKAIELGGVEEVIANGKSPIIVENDSKGHLRVLAAGEDAIDVNVYNLAGQVVATVRGDGGEASLDLPSFGVFITSVKGEKSSAVAKVIVR